MSEPARSCLNPTGRRWLGPTAAPSNLTQPVGFGMNFLPFFSSQRGALHQVHWVQNVTFVVLQNSALNCLPLVLASVQFELQRNDSGPVSSPNSCSQNASHALGFFMPQTHQDKLTNSRPGVVWTDWQIGFLGGPVKAATLLHHCLCLRSTLRLLKCKVYYKFNVLLLLIHQVVQAD